jgi:hypothetical protein
LTKQFSRIIAKFFVAVSSSLAAGFCIGLIQGWFAFGRDSSVDRSQMAILSGVLGAEVAIILGPVLYYTLLRSRFTWRIGAAGFLTCLFFGASSAWSLASLTKIGGWLSVFITPLIALLFSVLIRLKPNSSSDNITA